MAARTALAAPTDAGIIRIQSLVIAVTSVLSLLGAAWIMASFLAFPNLRSFRHYLILGLAISDCAMALNFLVSSAKNVGGRWIGAPEQAGFCSFNGFMTQVFVIQTDYWVLIIAVCTYFILADHKRSSAWVQEHPVILWALPWLLSTVWAAVGLGTAGYGDIGAWCWFTSDQVRLLVNFVPRWAIIVAMFVMYARLYFVLFRAHRYMVSLDAEQSGSLSWSGSRQPNTSQVSSRQHTHRLKRLARRMLLYPLAYAIVWSLPTIIRIYQTISGQAAPWQAQTLDKACVVLQGVVDATIYGATESSLSSWRNLLFPRRLPAVSRSAPADAHSGSEMDGGKSLRRRCRGGADEDGLVSGTESTDQLELGAVTPKEPRAGIEIRKTVEVTVLSGYSGMGSRRQQEEVGHGGIRWPSKSYFPGSSNPGLGK
ncbi:hypothetical protein BT67DRAFT_368437 [Trichocladium antarcticum]|uniref:G-protein coupled receptors family 2 profile 2 domain-containing protein n=1 Tax=Trichocladium antarcticum TaxID=1450529 RepID=A0AAN6USK1_9PEZI|nr:hypothetical protein BT67DRAFT_368437 [Trichocladium antarcticum]